MEIDVSKLQEICNLEINYTQEKFDDAVSKTAPECYDLKAGGKWTAKAIAGFLNELYNTDKFGV